MHNQVDVVIVGAGPVGMLMGSLLGSRGVSVAIVEQEASFHRDPRASSCDDEAMRVYQLAGLVDELQKTILACPELEFCDAAGAPFARIHFEGLDRGNGFNALNFFHQPTLESVLYAGLGRYPSVSVHLAHRVSALVQDEGGVDVTVVDASGERRVVRGRYLLGCDGRKSTTRKLAGVDYVGRRYEEPWLAISAVIDPFPPTLPHARFLCDPRRPGFIERGAEQRARFEFMLLPGETKEEIEQPASVERLIAPYVDPARVRIERASVYTFEAKMAERWRVGRIFLLGDAAHAMPPFMGQGLTTGLRDAANLAWKLALVLDGAAGDRLLDTYEAERRAHTQAMMATTIALGNVFLYPGDRMASVRNAVLRGLDRIPRFRRMVTDMEFKPVPAYDEGAMLHGRRRKSRFDGMPGVFPLFPEGTILPQPLVRAEGPAPRRLDDVLGPGFAVLGLGADPRAVVRDEALWRRLGARFLRVVPERLGVADEITDTTGALTAWFQRYGVELAVVRPDKFVIGGFSRASAGEVEPELRRVLGC